MASKIHPKYASRTRPPVEPRKFDAVLFDIDNVLVDTRRSYLEAIRYTVEIFLTHGDVPFSVNLPAVKCRAFVDS